MTIEQIGLWVVAGWTFITTVVIPFLVRAWARSETAKVLQKYKDETLTIKDLKDTVKNLQQGMKQLEKQIEEWKRKKQ